MAISIFQNFIFRLFRGNGRGARKTGSWAKPVMEGSLSSYFSLVRAKLTPRERGWSPPPRGDPPPLRGWCRVNDFSEKPVGPIPEIFRPKVWKVSWEQKPPNIAPGNSPPTLRYSCAKKKNQEISGNFGVFFGQKTQKTPFLTSFWPLTRPRGLFKAQNGAQSCSLTYCGHNDYLVANFGRIFFGSVFF